MRHKETSFETYISAEQQEEKKQAWFSGPNGLEKRKKGFGKKAGKGKGLSDGQRSDVLILAGL